jgi:hypothetical protein
MERNTERNTEDQGKGQSQQRKPVKMNIIPSRSGGREAVGAILDDHAGVDQNSVTFTSLSLTDLV